MNSFSSPFSTITDRIITLQRANTIRNEMGKKSEAEKKTLKLFSKEDWESEIATLRRRMYIVGPWVHGRINVDSYVTFSKPISYYKKI